MGQLMKHNAMMRQTFVTPVATGLLQRCGGVPCPPGTCDHDEESILRRSDSGAAPSSVPPIVNEVLNSPGQPLGATTRAYMEPRFSHDFSRVGVTRPSPAGLSIGPTDSPAESEANHVANHITDQPPNDPLHRYDFGDVRIHSDTKAAVSAQMVGARAYTVGNHVVFAGGQYAPDGLDGTRLLAHELAHVAQNEPQNQHVIQRQAIQGPPDPKLSRCKELLARIKSAVAELLVRAFDLVTDPQGLQWENWNTPKVLPDGTRIGSVVGHQHQYEGWRSRLRNLISQWDDDDCNTTGLRVPGEARALVFKVAPVPVPRPKPNLEPKPWERPGARRAGAAAKGAAIGGGLGLVLGGIVGAVLGGGAGTFVAPGVGTISGGAAGAAAGAEAGLSVGAAAGIAIGGLIGWLLEG
ncbi:DUF4157 domain-containing protein [Streptomyces sp. A2-16]|uniref:eCIS core domain-containing protein n=1 Tax=Streptomyces sp. A2-16 TaxID=2781734 RepID=UPI002010F890|nr:DUF4157 domain-containing protein [Streptomyces sp. A2-16]